MYTVHFKDSEGKITTVDAPVGLSILEIAHKNGIPVEGACGGGLACSTCHLIVADQDFVRIHSNNPPCEEEEDLLDTVFDLKPTSRLSCQIIMKAELDGATFIIPKATRNILLEY